MASRSEQLRAAILGQKPTPEQIAAIFAEETEFLLRATPGSGKTWTSCRRFLWRSEQWTDADGGLALLSFTNTAITEFETASISAGRGHCSNNSHFVGTLDSFVEKFIIAPFGHLIRGKSKRPRLHLAPRPGDRNNPKLSVWVTLNGNRRMQVPAWEIMPYMAGDDLAFKWYGKGTQIDTANGLKAIESLLEYGYYTHNLRNFWACHLLEQNPRLAQIVARRFPELIIDEAQDTSFWLIYLLRLLKKGGSKITLVGDPDQCIYEFSLASSKSIIELKQEWSLIEKPLNKSFRCNDVIASAARHIGGNNGFTGCGVPKNDHSKAYVIADGSDSYGRALAIFQEKAAKAELLEADCSILCRGHDQVARIRGTARYLALEGKTKRMAEAAFLRDKRGDYKGAFDVTESILRELSDSPDVWAMVDDDPDSEAASRIKLTIWNFVRSPSGLPAITQNGAAWIAQLRTTMTALLKDIGVQDVPSLGKTFQKRGIEDNQIELSLFEDQNLFPALKYDTIHHVKGESIDGVFVVGSKKFFDKIVSDVTAAVESEERRLGYVAMTRARHLLVVVLDPKHLSKHRTFWTDRGFEVID